VISITLYPARGGCTHVEVGRGAAENVRAGKAGRGSFESLLGESVNLYSLSSLVIGILSTFN
jgi:hypothetical protein